MGNIGVRLGAAYAWHDIETGRSVSIPGFSDSLASSYDGHTGQLFGEVGRTFEYREAQFEPFARLAYVDTQTDAFTETGGDAALSGDQAGLDATLTMLGLRASAMIDLGGLQARAHGLFGWQHAFGDAVPLVDVSFAGQQPFAIAGAPTARDMAALDLGLDIDAGPATRFGLAYSGRFGDGSQSQAITASFAMKF